jgi:hypothetical protein
LSYQRSLQCFDWSVASRRRNFCNPTSLSPSLLFFGPRSPRALCSTVRLKCGTYTIAETKISMAIARLLRRNFVVPSYIRPSRDMLSIGTKDQYSTTRLLRRESSVAPSYSTPVSAKRRTCLAASITFCWDFRKGLKPSAFRMGLKSKQVSGVRFTQLTPSWTDWGDLDRQTPDGSNLLPC